VNRLNAYRGLLVWLLIGVMMILLFNILSMPKKGEQEMIFSDFMGKLDADDIQEVIIKGNVITGQLKDGKNF